MEFVIEHLKIRELGLIVKDYEVGDDKFWKGEFNKCVNDLFVAGIQVQSRPVLFYLAGMRPWEYMFENSSSFITYRRRAIERIRQHNIAVCNTTIQFLTSIIR